MKNDRKIILFLFGVEAIMLSILLLISSIMTAKQKTVLERNVLRSEFSQNSLDHSMYLSYFTSLSQPELTKPQSTHNYYTFNLTTEGITSNRMESNAGLTTGLAWTSLSDSQITIKAAKNASNPTILSQGNLYIQNPYLNKNLSLKDVLSEPLTLKKLDGSGTPQVMIYHTHTREAYCMTESDRKNVQSSFNEDKTNTKNVVVAGNYIMETLLKRDIATHHDITVHTEQRVNGVWQDCYYFGKQTLTGLLNTYKDTQLVLDVHRDGVTNPNRDTIRHKTVVLAEDGTEYAQIMLVVGLNFNASYKQDDVFNPHWKDNFKLALLVIEKLEEKVPGITRGISLRREAYNQNLAQNTLLVEMGFDGNLVSEVTASSQLLGEVLAEIYS